LNLEKYNKAQKYKTKHRKQTLSMLEKTCLNHWNNKKQKKKKIVSKVHDDSKKKKGISLCINIVLLIKLIVSKVKQDAYNFNKSNKLT